MAHIQDICPGGFPGCVADRVNSFDVNEALTTVMGVGNHFEMLRPDTAKYFEGFWRRSGKAWDLAYAIEVHAGVAETYAEAGADVAEK